MADDNLRNAVSPTEADNTATNPFFHVLTDGTNPLSVTGGVLDVNATVTLETAYADNSTEFTLDSSDVNAQGYLVDEAAFAATVTEGNIGLARMTANRIILTALEDASGNRLVIGSGGQLTVEATDLDIRDIVHTQDSVALGDGTGILVDVLDGTIDALYVAITDGDNVLAPNADGSINVVVAGSAGTPIHDYDQSAATAKDATANHDYTVAGTSFNLRKVTISGAGRMKAEIQTGPVGTLVSKITLFKERETTVPHEFTPAVVVPSTGTGTVRVIKTQRSLGSLFMYSTIEGEDVA